MMRYRLLTSLIPATWKTLPWPALAGGILPGPLLAAVPAITSTRSPPPGYATLLRLAALAGALGVAYLLDDPARTTTSVVPVPRWLRWCLRVTLTAVPVTAWWAGTLLVAWLGMDHATRTGMPFTTISLEAATMLTLAAALSATASRRPNVTHGSTIAIPVLLALAALITRAPRSVALIVPPADPRWTQVHQAWAVLLISGLISFITLSHESGR
jgi:hypothetical protein